MLRNVYRFLVALHPSSFEDRFSEELMWIFDIRDPEYSSWALIFDCFHSLGRQWLSDSRLWAFGMSFLINCFVFHKMIGAFLLDIRRLVTSFL